MDEIDDVDALLEESLKERGHSEKLSNDMGKRSSPKHAHERSRSRSREKSRKSKERDGRDRSRRERDRDRDRERDRDRDRDRHRDRRRDGEKERDRDRDRARDRESHGGVGGGAERDRERDRERRDFRRNDRERFPDRRRSGSRDRRRSPVRRELSPELTPEERDARTVFVWQLSARIRSRDLEEFFSAVGKIRDVRLIMDNKTRRSKGIAYVEFRNPESVQLALGLTGTKLLGVPIQVQVSQAEKNRMGQAANTMNNVTGGKSGPMKLYVGSLHYNITEEMLRGIFEPFGKIDEIKLIKESGTGRSQGYGFVTYQSQEDAKKALEQLNGFELAGRPMKVQVGHVVERADGTAGAASLDNEELDKAGIDLGNTGRLALMAKLAEGTGMEMPQAAQSALQLHQQSQAHAQNQAMLGALGGPGPGLSPGNPGSSNGAVSQPPLATQCFMLSNMFGPEDMTGDWEREIRADVIEECNLYGGVLHVYVDKMSPTGNVYVKCPNIAAASQCVNALHGRYFSRRVVTASYVPLPSYHSLFPDAANAKSVVALSAASRY